MIMFSSLIQQASVDGSAVQLDTNGDILTQRNRHFQTNDEGLNVQPMIRQGKGDHSIKSRTTDEPVPRGEEEFVQRSLETRCSILAPMTSLSETDIPVRKTLPFDATVISTGPQPTSSVGIEQRCKPEG